MPAAIPLIVQGAATFLGASSLVQAAVLVTASLVVGKYQADKAKKKAKRAFEASLRDNTAVIRSAVAERNIIYGRRMVSGPLCLFETGGDLKQFLYMVVVLADGESDGVEDIYLNDQPIGPLDAQGFPTGGPFRRVVEDRPTSSSRTAQPQPNTTTTLLGDPGTTLYIANLGDSDSASLQEGVDYTRNGTVISWLNTDRVQWMYANSQQVVLNYRYSRVVNYVKVNIHLGQKGQTADPMLLSEVSSKWNSSYIGEGVTYLVLRLQLNTEVFPNGPPNVKAVVRGRKCYDPRLNLANNPSFKGAVASDTGPGTVPDGLSFTSGVNGIERRIVGVGEEDGMPYVDVRYFGTASVTSVFNAYVLGPVASSPGQTWNTSLKIKRIAGSMASANPSFRLVSFTGSTSVESSLYALNDGNVNSGEFFEATLTKQFNTAHDNVRAFVRWNATSGQSMDLTLRLAMPLLWNTATHPIHWTQNPVLQIRDYLKQLEVTDWELDDSYFIAEANVCEESIPIVGGQFEQRYQCNVDLSTGDTPLANLSALTSSMEGTCTLFGGEWRVYAARYRTPVLALSDSDLLDNEPVSIQPRAPIDQLFNGVRGKYVEPNKYWQSVDFPPYISSAYRQEDNGLELVQDVEYPGVLSPWQAQRLAKIMLHRSRQSLTVTASFWWRAMPLQPGDFMTWTSARYGWTNKTFVVLEVSISLENGIKLVLQEESVTSYQWDYSEASGVDPSPNTELPSAFFVSPPTGLVLESGDEHILLNSDGTLITRIFVKWDPVTDQNVLNGGRVEVQYKAVNQVDWESAPSRPADDNAAYTGPVQDGMTYEVRVRFINGLQVASQWTYSSLHTVLGKQALPSNVPGLQAVLEAFGIRLVIQQAPDRDIKAYELREGSSWLAGSLITRIAGTPGEGASAPLKYLHQQMTAGVRTFRVKAIDALDQESAVDTTATLTILAPTVSTISNFIKGQNVELSWTASPGSFPIVRYRILYGSTYASATHVADALTTRYATKVDYGGTRRYWIVAVDQYGNESTPQSEDVTVLNPASMTLSAEVIDNNIILRFSDATTTLPIERYEITKGATYAGSVPVGDNGNGRFAMFFEQVQGTYIYWVRAIDTAGNVSPVASISAYMSQPPDYVLRSDLNVQFDNTFTYSNAAPVGGVMVGPVSLTETWLTHYTNNSWTTPNDQVAAGFPVYAQPNVASGWAEYQVDYGAVLSGTSCIVTMSYEDVGSSLVNVTYQISFKAAAGDAWQDAPPGNSQYLANFRYIKVRINFARQGSDRTALIKASNLNIRLATKLVNDNGTATSNASDATGTVVYFNRQFVYVDGPPVVQPQGTTPIIPMVEFDGSVPYPTSFKVRLYDTNGNRVTGSFSWTARGA